MSNLEYLIEVAEQKESWKIHKAIMRGIVRALINVLTQLIALDSPPDIDKVKKGIKYIIDSLQNIYKSLEIRGKKK